MYIEAKYDCMCCLSIHGEAIRYKSCSFLASPTLSSSSRASCFVFRNTNRFSSCGSSVYHSVGVHRNDGSNDAVLRSPVVLVMLSCDLLLPLPWHDQVEGKTFDRSIMMRWARAQPVADGPPADVGQLSSRLCLSTSDNRAPSDRDRTVVLDTYSLPCTATPRPLPSHHHRFPSLTKY